jgi:hypothetical protein
VVIGKGDELSDGMEGVEEVVVGLVVFLEDAFLVDNSFDVDGKVRVFVERGVVIPSALKRADVVVWEERDWFGV